MTEAPKHSSISAAVPGHHNTVIQVLGSNNRVQMDGRLNARDPRVTRERSILIKRMRSFWIDSVLNPSLRLLGNLDLDWEIRFDRALKSAEARAQKDSEILRPKSIADAFRQVGEYLLILGSVGTGKTTLLLELAASLLDEAENDATKQIPIVFQLSSWARDIEFEHWLARELTAMYDVPRGKALELIQNEEVFPLLDSLDEVNELDREPCVEAIRKFRNAHGLVPLVVTCRLDDYLAVGHPLEPYGTATIKPLTKSKIEVYLESKEGEEKPLLNALSLDPSIWELLDSPLMLALARSVFKANDLQPLNLDGSGPDGRTKLIKAFVAAKLSSSDQKRFDEAERGLSWMAGLVLSKKLSVFYVEEIQPDWIGRPWATWLVKAGAPLSIAALICSILATTLVLVGASTATASALSVILCFFITSCLAGATVANYRKLRWSWRQFGVDVKTLLSPPAAAPAANFALYVQQILLSLLEIGLVEDELRELRGARGRRRWLRNGFYTARHALLVAAIASCAAGVFVVITDIILLSTKDTATNLLSLAFLITATSIVPVCWVALRRGPADWIRHIVIRLVLAMQGSVPFRVDPFLNKLVGQAILYRSGGGYVFRHRLFLEYFANKNSATVIEESHPR